jgi:hypothetical protein
LVKFFVDENTKIKLNKILKHFDKKIYHYLILTRLLEINNILSIPDLPDQIKNLSQITLLHIIVAKEFQEEEKKGFSKLIYNNIKNKKIE